MASKGYEGATRLSSRPARKFFEDCVSGLKLEGIGTERRELIAIEEELLTASSGRVRKEGGSAFRAGPPDSSPWGSCKTSVSAEIRGSKCGAGTLLTGSWTEVDCCAPGATAAAVGGGVAVSLTGSLFWFISSVFAARFG